MFIRIKVLEVSNVEGAYTNSENAIKAVLLMRLLLQNATVGKGIFVTESHFGSSVVTVGWLKNGM